jgi:hypothetical protein
VRCTAARIGCGAVFALTLLLAAAASPDNVSDLRTRFERETDPVRKAKLMPQLGEAQFRNIRDKVHAGQFPEAVAELGHYETEAQECEHLLRSTGIDVAKHPGGFKELEISIRESLRRLNEMVHSMASDEQEPFLKAREELSEMDERLVQQLFPKRP